MPKYLGLLILLAISFAGCRLWEEDIDGTCGYELTFSGHYLRIPVSIEPHKLEYKVGDTIKISTVFSDSIYDLGTENTFKIEDFPFRPSSMLFGLTDSLEKFSGYTANEIIISSEYNPTFWKSSNLADGYRAEAIYEDGLYHFESTVVLDQVGSYILVFSDVHRSNLSDAGAELNKEADATEFEGKCEYLQYFLCSMISSGDDNLDQFVEELDYLDKEIYDDRLRYQFKQNDHLGKGSISVEFTGFFGFRVVE